MDKEFLGGVLYGAVVLKIAGQGLGQIAPGFFVIAEDRHDGFVQIIIDDVPVLDADQQALQAEI